jgi:hypothetical protein
MNSPTAMITYPCGSSPNGGVIMIQTPLTRVNSVIRQLITLKIASMTSSGIPVLDGMFGDY